MRTLKVYAVHSEGAGFVEDEELASEELVEGTLSARVRLTATVLDAEMNYDVYLDNSSIASGTTEAFGTSGKVGFYMNRLSGCEFIPHEFSGDEAARTCEVVGSCLFSWDAEYLSDDCNDSYGTDCGTRIDPTGPISNPTGTVFTVTFGTDEEFVDGGQGDTHSYIAVITSEGKSILYWDSGTETWVPDETYEVCPVGQYTVEFLLVQDEQLLGFEVFLGTSDRYSSELSSYLSRRVTISSPVAVADDLAPIVYEVTHTFYPTDTYIFIEDWGIYDLYSGYINFTNSDHDLNPDLVGVKPDIIRLWPGDMTGFGHADSIVTADTVEGSPGYVSVVYSVFPDPLDIPLDWTGDTSQLYYLYFGRGVPADETTPPLTFVKIEFLTDPSNQGSEIPEGYELLLDIDAGDPYVTISNWGSWSPYEADMRFYNHPGLVGIKPDMVQLYLGDMGGFPYSSSDYISAYSDRNGLAFMDNLPSPIPAPLNMELNWPLWDTSPFIGFNFSRTSTATIPDLTYVKFRFLRLI